MAIVINGSGTVTGISAQASDVELTDNTKLKLGTGDDLEVYHDGSNSYIDDTGTGNLLIKGQNLKLLGSNGDNTVFCQQGGAVTLYHNNVAKLATTANGVDVTGGSTTAANLTITSTATDDNIAPDLILYRDSSSPADNDNLGGIIWQGNHDGGGQNSYAQIICKTEDVSDGSEDGMLRFYTCTGGSMSEKMRLTKEGNLYINTTGELGYNTEGVLQVLGKTANTAMKIQNTSNGQRAIHFFNAAAGEVGHITCSSSATTYSTSSDYRIKENVDYTWDATTRLKQLKPCRFNFIVDDTNTLVDGFLAHEVTSIVPEAITGEKDAVDSDGNIVHQGIDQSKLVPLLVKTIQELEARITALEA